jgi:hypothetical protein
VRPAIEEEIPRRRPDWFGSRGDVTRSLMGLGFQHSDGWSELLVRTFERIEPLVVARNREFAACGSHFEILEVKQKFGELRIIAMSTNEAIYAAFHLGL